MAKLMKITPDQLKAARKAGFGRKCPKKPKKSASVAQLENYISSHNTWVKEAKAKASKKASESSKKKSLQKAVFG